MKTVDNIHVTSFLLLGTVYSILLNSSPSFAFSLYSPYSLRPSPSSSQLSAIENDNHEERTSNGETIGREWELMEDWILQDRLPEFTVRGSIRSITPGSSRRRKAATISTFWRQLKQTIPELSSRTEFELEDRYNTLAAAAAENSSSSSATPFIKCGQSPEVLTDWCLGVVEKKAGNANNSDSSATRIMMHGSLSNGSSIWFPLQSAGIVDASSSVSNPDGNKKGDAETDFLWLLEEGNRNDDAYRIKYVEASGGCIYELGTPKPNAMMLVNEDEEKSNLLAGFQAIELDQAKERLSSSTTSTGMALSAVIATSLLSASLAFFAGQESSISLQSRTTPTGMITPSKNAVLPKQQQQQQQQQQPSQAITPAVLGSGMKYERSVQRDGTQKIVELSTSEQRASQELRVYREERRLKDLQEQRSDDDERLIALKEWEAKQGPEELSIREQRTLELKIGGDKRKILRMQESLTRDKTKLKELQDEEVKQQQQLF